MEGRHFAAGPWFAVLEAGAPWHVRDTIWISNGPTNTTTRVEIRVDWEASSDES